MNPSKKKIDALTKIKINARLEEGRISFFSKEDIKNLFGELLKYAKDQQILNFIKTMDFYCGEYAQKGKSLSADKRRKRRDEINGQLIRPILAIIERLKKLKSGNDVICYPEVIERLAFLEDSHDGKGELKSETWTNRLIQQESEKAIEVLSELITTLEAANKIFNAPMKKGRPGTDQYGLVKLIVRFYDHFIDDPTAYPQGGAYIAVEIILQALKIPHSEFPDRAIKKAIAELKNDPIMIKNR